MKFKFVHNNLNVLDLERSMKFHLAFTVDDYDAAHAKHKEMGCICYENPGMGIYFINDPDGYWLEVLPQK